MWVGIFYTIWPLNDFSERVRQASYLLTAYEFTIFVRGFSILEKIFLSRPCNFLVIDITWSCLKI